MQEDFINTSIAFHVISPKVTLPPLELKFKKDFASEERIIGFSMDIKEAVLAHVSIIFCTY